MTQHSTTSNKYKVRFHYTTNARTGDINTKLDHAYSNRISVQNINLIQRFHTLDIIILRTIYT